MPTNHRPRRGVQPTSAAGLKHRRLVDAVVESRIAGQTMREIAAAQGCSVSTVHKALYEAYHQVAGLDLDQRRLALGEYVARCEWAMQRAAPAADKGDTKAIDSYLRAAERIARAYGVHDATRANEPDSAEETAAAISAALHAAAKAEVAGFEARLRKSGRFTEEQIAEAILASVGGQ